MSHQKKVSYVSVQDSSNQKTSVIQYTRKWRLSKLVRKIKCELKLNDSNFRLVQKDGSIIENIKDVKDNEQLYIVRADADTELKTSINLLIMFNSISLTFLNRNTKYESW